MWYRTRYAYNLVLTAFQIIGLLLLGLGTAAITLAAIAVVFDAARRLLSYDLLLTENTLSVALTFGIGSCSLGALLALLGLSATDPKYLQKQK